jgi:TetR/AcrR family transcriptional regulator, repressor of the mexAB-oprM multidrug resistance operon
MTFIIGTLPLVFATGAGAASRQEIGTVVVGGMLAPARSRIAVRAAVLHAAGGIADHYGKERAEHDPLGFLRELCRVALARLDENETFRNVYTILLNRCEYAGEMNTAFAQQMAIDEENLAKVEIHFRQARELRQVAERVEPRVATLALYSLMYGIFVAWLRRPGRFDLRQDGGAMLELFFAGLQG